ncbi:proline-rich receptor-like protein kinase PERK2 isoform X1 [Mauremys mutica]|uniref:proline-rich receptor-like protein kinase PERK2 isoform X1 n=1 Tax=Mauremys mutica TaxID=74926 RepID=UPI001D16F963|nr:proline-rich receptor-like protein kinase PERK2 isoform X1 [Mauremys mutica]
MATEGPCASPTLAPEEPPASPTLAPEESPAITSLATEEPPASPTLATEEPPSSPTLALEEPPAITTLATEEPPARTTLATEKPPASPTLAPEEPPASPEQELSDGATNPSSSAYSCGASSSSVGSGSPEFLGSLFGDTPSAQVSWPEEEEEKEEEEEEEEDSSPITVIQQHLKGRAEVQKSPSCAAPQSVLLLVPSPPRQGGLSQRIPHPQWGDTAPLLSGTPKWGHLSHTGQGFRYSQTLSQFQPHVCAGRHWFREGGGFPCPAPWRS